VSTLHRAKPPVVGGTVLRRRSAAYFLDGNIDATIASVPGGRRATAVRPDHRRRAHPGDAGWVPGRAAEHQRRVRSRASSPPRQDDIAGLSCHMARPRPGSAMLTVNRGRGSRRWRRGADPRSATGTATGRAGRSPSACHQGWAVGFVRNRGRSSGVQSECNRVRGRATGLGWDRYNNSDGHHRSCHLDGAPARQKRPS
jgi:hypothetical protein